MPPEVMPRHLCHHGRCTGHDLNGASSRSPRRQDSVRCNAHCESSHVNVVGWRFCRWPSGHRRRNRRARSRVEHRSCYRFRPLPGLLAQSSGSWQFHRHPELTGMEFDVQQRHMLLARTHRALRLYALVDGVQYTRYFETPLTPLAGRRALFHGTDDAALAHAGPWLIDAEHAGSEQLAGLVELERAAPAVTWLIAPQDLEGLAQLLSLRLDMRLPDGRSALVRFWDPRVLANLAELLDGNQREEFFAHIHEWHMLHNGQRAWIGRNHADAQ